MVKYADFDIDIEILALGAFRGLGKRRKLRHSGVHEKHINVSQLLRNLGGQFVHVRQLGHVPFHRHHTVSDGLHGFIQRFSASTKMAIFAPSSYNRLAAASAMPPYYRHFSSEPLHDTLR
jgi:hypothetical protein